MKHARARGGLVDAGDWAPRLFRAAGARSYFLPRPAYSWVSVLIVMTSPSLTKCGTWTTNPVSIVADLRVLVTAAFFIPGSVRTTWRSTVFGGVTLSGVVS